MKSFKKSRRICMALPLVLMGLPALAQTTKKSSVKKAVPHANAIVSNKSGARKLPANPAITTRPASVSAATWAKVVALKPGMTRADLMQVFQEEGGISSRTFRTYILRGSHGKGPYLKINATFAPDPSPVDWQDANGLLQITAPAKTNLSGERSGDVILSLSPVYWGYMIAD